LISFNDFKSALSSLSHQLIVEEGIGFLFEQLLMKNIIAMSAKNFVNKVLL
jgi:hypothetical protein